MKQRRHVCPFCKRDLAVTPHGWLRRHSPDRGFQLGPMCEGSRHRVAEPLVVEWRGDQGR